MKVILVIMSFLSMLIGSKKHVNDNIKVLSPTEFKSHIEGKSVQLVDVRTPLEFKNGHIGGAINIDYYSGKFNLKFDELDKEKAVYLYCRSGSRSKQTSNKLAAMGFTEIYDLHCGIKNYR